MKPLYNPHKSMNTAHTSLHEQENQFSQLFWNHSLALLPPEACDHHHLMLSSYFYTRLEAGGVVEGVACLPRKHKVLSSIPRTTKKKKDNLLYWEARVSYGIKKVACLLYFYTAIQLLTSFISETFYHALSKSPLSHW
jgi:hypothetical protein